MPRPKLTNEERKARAAERARAWRAANPDKVKASNRAAYKANSEQRIEYARAYRENNPEKVAECLRAWRAANPEKVKANNRAWRAANHEKVAEQGRAYYKRNAEQIAERARAYRQANAEQIAERVRAWRKANPEKVAKCIRAWRQANAEKIREQGRAWRAANPEKSREFERAWRAANPEKIRERKRARLRTDPQYKAAWLMRRWLDQSLRQKITPGGFGELLGCSASDLRAYIEARFLTGWTWENRGAVWELDHVRALSSFDLLDPEQMAQAGHHTNLMPLSKADHKAKTIADTAAARQRRKQAGPVTGKRNTKG